MEFVSCVSSEMLEGIEEIEKEIDETEVSKNREALLEFQASIEPQCLLGEGLGKEQKNILMFLTAGMCHR